MKLADLHCDTPLELYRQGCGLYNDKLHISLSHTEGWETYIQCAAIWSNCRLDGAAAYEVYQNAVADFKEKAGARIRYRGSDIPETGTSFILCVEDAKILCGDLTRLEALYRDGVRILTLVWKEEMEIGGAWDTEVGLTPFGKEVVRTCFDLGIVPDVSHGSWALIRDVLELAKTAGKPVVATHCNAYAAAPITRNLTDELFCGVAASGGVVGVSLCPWHLNDSESCTSEDVLRHMERYLSLGGEDALAFGCDFDGIDTTPADICNVGQMEAFYDKVAGRLGSRTADKIFFENAYRFLRENI